MNAINNASLLLSSDKTALENDELLRTRLRSLCNWIYTLEPTKVPNSVKSAVEVPNMDDNDAIDIEEPMDLSQIPF